MNEWRSLGLASLFLMFSAGCFCFPRILYAPRPESPERYHHHRGDGSSEVVAIVSYYYWSMHGLFENCALPCADPDWTHLANHCEGYTHYPPMPHWLGAGLLHAFGAAHDFVKALQWTRVCIFLLNIIIAGWALSLLNRMFGLGSWGMFIAASFLGSCRGFWLYADNLYGHGTATSLLGLLLAIVLTQAKDPAIWTLTWASRMYAAATFIAMWVSWETAPAAWLLPMLLWTAKIPRAAAGPAVRKLFLVAVIASVAAIVLRFGQNSMALGGWKIAMQDWTSATAARSLDTGHAITAKSLISLNFLARYTVTLLGRQRYMIGNLGVAVIAAYLLLNLMQKDWKGLAFWMWLYAASLSWNGIMLQHSFIHAFTSRYIVWPATVALVVLMAHWKPTNDELS